MHRKEKSESSVPHIFNADLLSLCLDHTTVETENQAKSLDFYREYAII